MQGAWLTGPMLKQSWFMECKQGSDKVHFCPTQTWLANRKEATGIGKKEIKVSNTIRG
jgi:hypothetical protein